MKYMELLCSMNPTIIRAVAAAASDLLSWTGFPEKIPKLEVENNLLYVFVEICMPKIVRFFFLLKTLDILELSIKSHD
jgi:hypothetical protein